MTTAEAAKRLHDQMYVDGVFQWSSCLYIGHLMASLQRIYKWKDSCNSDAIGVLSELLTLVHKERYISFHDTVSGKIVFTIPPNPLWNGEQLMKLQEALEVVITTCHYYSVCCNDLTNYDLWSQYDKYQFEQYYG